MFYSLYLSLLRIADNFEKGNHMKMKNKRSFLLISLVFAIGLVFLYPLNLARASYLSQQVGLNEISLTLAELSNLDPNASSIFEDKFSSGRFDLLVPSDWDVQPGSTARLHVSTNVGQTNLLPSVELVVLLNGKLVYSTVISTPGEQWITFSIPDYWGQGQDRGDRLEIQVSAPGGCDITLSQTTYLFYDSEITLLYEPMPVSIDMAGYPSPVYQPAYFNQVLNIALPRKSSPEEVEAVLALAAELGKLSFNSLDFHAINDLTVEEALALEGNLIIVGTPDNNAIIKQLQLATSLPADIRQRRFELVTSISDIMIPGISQTYSVNVKNTEAGLAEGLKLSILLPETLDAARVTCSPECQKISDRLEWTLPGLRPDDTITYSISFEILDNQISSTGQDYLDFTSELLMGQTPVNVSTLKSSVLENGDPIIINSTIVSDSFFVANGHAVPESDGLIQLVTSPWSSGRPVLLVTGLTEEAVYKAGRALGAESNFPGFKGQLVLVREVLPIKDETADFAPVVTFAQLGYTDKVVSGVGIDSVSYRFFLPAKYLTSKDAKIRLFFSHSALLDPTTSSMTLALNGVPFGSALLDGSNKEQGILEAALPPSASRPGKINNLTISVNSQIGNPCGATGNNPQLWVSFDSTSILSLQVVDNPEKNTYNLDQFPLPFAVNPNLEQTKFSLPVDPSHSEFSLAFQMAALLGSSSNGNNFNPQVVMGMPQSQEELTAYHMIVIGRPSRNPLLQLINESLPQPFISGRDEIKQQVDDYIFRLPDSLDLGYLQLLQSSWNSENAILALTGTTDDALSWALESLIDETKNNLVKGNLILTPNIVDVFSIDTRELLLGGTLSALGTAIPDIELLGTATSSSGAEANGQIQDTDLSDDRERPAWFPYLVTIVGAVITIAALVFVSRKLRNSKDS